MYAHKIIGHLDFLIDSGVLVVAEVVSRFVKVGSFVRKVEKMGFSLQSKVSLTGPSRFLTFERSACDVFHFKLIS